MKKKNFLLIEFLIALGIVAAFAIPVLSLPASITSSHIRSLYAMECERHADLIFLDILASLRGSDPWKELKTTKQSSKWKAWKALDIDLPELGTKTFPISYVLWKSKGKVSKEQVLYAVLHCDLSIDKQLYKYEMVIQKSDPEQVSQEEA